MKKNLKLMMIFVLALVLFAGCNSDKQVNNTKNEDGEKKLKILTTIYPQYDFAKKIAGDKAEIRMLLKPGTETHSYEPSPKDIEDIKNSDLFIYVGSENDHWVSRVFESFEDKKPDVIKLIDCVDTVEEKIVEGMEHKHKHDESERGDEHKHEDVHEIENERNDGHKHEEKHNDEDKHEGKHEIDEHVWTSPKNAIKLVNKIKEKIIEKDPKNKNFYEENAKKYIEDLSALDKELKEVVSKAKRKTILFGDRFPFRYLADDYGLKYYAAFTGCSNETEADANTIIFLEEKIREEKIPVVFTIEMANGKLADAICEDTGVKKLVLHSCHNLTKDEKKAGEDYISIMKQNVQNLKEALN